MRKDKEKVFALRAKGKSYNEIRSLIRVPKSTLSEWFRDQKWSNKIAFRLASNAQGKSTIRIKELNKIRGENLEKLYKEAENEATEEFEKLKYHPLFLAGMMIYWGEGNKRSNNRCSIANSDPLMIKVFLDFLKKICGFSSPKIRAWILLYPELKEKECKTFWISNTGLKQEDFTKSIVIKGKHKTRKLSHGVCSIGVSSTYLKRKILLWMNLIAADLIEEKYNAGIV
ncbi:MAG: hypothetical protein PHS53_01475 [Candidatus Pacebacteria bacterium]|nr:hypothetical protein [Candidatus Paceibacterota bacterium]MDD5356800.1 hypothetical protein [Candidatus Paceibacterota bacterium]